MGKNEFEKKMQIKRTRTKLSNNLEKLESDKQKFVERAKTAYQKGDKHSYSLARSGLASTLTQLNRTREMLLNIDITTQMRDTGTVTEEFLTGMETIFRQLSKVNKSTNIKSARDVLRKAIAGMEGVQEQLDDMLMESEDNFVGLSGANVSDAEIDGLLGLSAAVDEEEEIGAQLEELKKQKELEEKEEEAKAAPAAVASVSAQAPKVYKLTPEPVAPPKSAAAVPPVRQAAPAQQKPLPPEKKPLDLKLNERFEFEFPPLELLDDYLVDAAVREANERELEEDAAEAEKVLAELGVPAKVVNRVVGPAFSRLEMAMPVGMSVQKIDPLVSDIAMRLGKQARFEVPIPGKNAFGIEVPNVRRDVIGLKEMVGSDSFVESHGDVNYCLAVNIDRSPVIKDLAKAPHMMIAGSTGSGKSCFLHSVITSLMYKYTPSRLKLAIIDFKRVEMAVYNGTPYLLTDKVVDNDEDALELFNIVCDEMERRYDLLVQMGCRNIGEYNDKCEPSEKLPFIAVFVDEYADISTSPLSKEFDAVIRKLSQKARASGIHLVLATQRPSTDVISGTIKNNFPVQIAFKVARKEDSRTTLAGQAGAESLLGNGDMLYNEPSGGGLKRMQAPFVSTEELRRVADWVITHSTKI